MKHFSTGIGIMPESQIPKDEDVITLFSVEPVGKIICKNHAGDTELVSCLYVDEDERYYLSLNILGKETIYSEDDEVFRAYFASALGERMNKLKEISGEDDKVPVLTLGPRIL